MNFDLTNHESLIAAFALVIIIILALAAFLDHRWRKTERLRGFGSDHKSNCPPGSAESVIGLYARYADLSARDLGTAEQQITFRGETQQDLEGIEPTGEFPVAGNFSNSSLTSRVETTHSGAMRAI